MVLGAMAERPSIADLCAPLKDELDLGRDLFAWPHPKNSIEVLFLVDDTTERVMGEVTS